MTAQLRNLLLITAFAMLTACSGDNGSAPASATASKPSSASMQPSDPDLASLYQQSCFSCHGTGAGGAPRTGTSEWAPRMAQGMDVLLDRTINGFNGMPPLGLCMDCAEEEFTALIEFMTSGVQ